MFAVHSRDDQDKFAFWSQQKTANAKSRKRFEWEIVPVMIGGKKETIVIAEDEFPKPDTTIEKLAKLKPAFRTDGKGSVTAGNSSGINDGSCAVLLASESAVKKYN